MLPVRRGRGRPSNTKKRAPSPSPPQSDVKAAPTAAAAMRRPQRRKLDLTSSPGHDEPQVAPKRRTAREMRKSLETSANEQNERKEARSGATAAASSRTNGLKTEKDGGARKTAATKPALRKKQQKQQADTDDEREADYQNTTQDTPKNIDEALVKDPNATKIVIPFSDTPINNRNKEFRKKGGAGGGGARRSSMSMRGRRASSLIESGQSAIPHREVEPSEFFKHIEAEGLSEPRRMKQLLTWCGERALSEKPQHGSTGANAVLG
ncbi:Mis12-Mtw1 protein family-domain-containing protein, partial [Coniella lustricola]